MTKTLYDRSFHESIQGDSLVSAEKIVPVLVSLLHPKSVVDVGCGTGAWLSVFQQNGVTDIQGIDGDYVDRAQLLIPKDRFMGQDVGRPLNFGRRFDLVLSVEVAEHVPEECSDDYLDNLTSLGDVIAFSAAIPHQGGTGHVNEQWPEYWKARFEQRGYVLVDCLRRRIWDDQKIEKWYRQNLLLYAKKSAVEGNPVLKKEYEENKNQIASIVHPDMFYPLSFKQLLRSLGPSFLRAVRKRV